MNDVRRPITFIPPRQLLERAAAMFPRHADLARHLRVTPSHVSRLLNDICGLGSEACIRLADQIGEERASVLEAFGHDRRLLQALLDRMTELCEGLHQRDAQHDAGKGASS